MSWQVTLRPGATKDLQEARQWYEQQRPGLGDEFLVFVAESLLQLEQAPEQHPVYYRGFRRIMTDRFPYKLFYKTEGKTVVVFRILHASRDHSWQLR